MALVDQIIGVESGGNPYAKNPRSSAMGAGQFIASTWLDMLKRHRPDLTTGKTDDEILALRADPDLSRAMTEAYASENAKKLESSGIPVTAGTSYLAHFAGPQGAVSVLSADPSIPVAQVLGEKVVRANPFLANMTAGDLRAWADKKMGAPQSAPKGQQAPQVSVPLPITPQQSMPPVFAPSPASSQPAESIFSQMPAQQMQAPPPIFAPPRRPIDLSKLRAALQAPNRGLFFGGT